MVPTSTIARTRRHRHSVRCPGPRTTRNEPPHFSPRDGRTWECGHNVTTAQFRGLADAVRGADELSPSTGGSSTRDGELPFACMTNHLVQRSLGDDALPSIVVPWVDIRLGA